MNHPSELKLERHLLDPSRSPVQDHVASCGNCQARLAQMEKQGEDFRRFVYPATLDNVTRPRFHFHFNAMRALWLAAPAAGLAAVLLMARTGPATDGPTPDYTGTKGAQVQMTVYAALPSGARPVDDGEALPASASLRFHVHALKPCDLSILSVDSSGQVSRLYTQKVQGDLTLPGGVRLDGKAGPERFFAVCGPGYAQVEEGARRVGDDVRQIRELPGVAAPQTSLLIEKKP
ncbi:MAG: DUF4384 domain-containing protein [Deltaproteobacteria bacterium]